MSQEVSISFEKEVYKKYYALVYSTCRRNLTDGSFIDDAIQATFLLYIKEENKIKSELSSWFYWSAKNVSIVINRDLIKQKHIQGNIQKEKSEIESIEFSLDSLISSLPKNKKELLLLKYYEGKTYLEIANLFQSNETTIRSRINSIIDLLRSKLKQKEANLGVILISFFKPGNILPLNNTPNNSTFILQNSLFQQSVLKGVYQMYFIAKLKIASLLFLVFILGFGSYLALRGDSKVGQKGVTVVADKDFLDQKVTIDFSHLTSISEIKSLLSKSNKLDIKLHDSLSSIKNSPIQPFNVIAKEMPLKEVLIWIKSTMDIDYALINNQIIFCSSQMKDKIDINYTLESFSLNNLFALSNSAKQNNDETTMNAENYREVIFDRISKDSWDDRFGTSIEILGDKLLVIHNKETLKNIRKLLSDFENIYREENNTKFIPTYDKPKSLIEINIQNSLKKKVSLKFSNKHFLEILEEIAKTNSLSIAYILESNQTFEKLSHEKINLDVESKTTSQVLNELLTSYSLKSQIINGAYFISSENYFEKSLTLERYNVRTICKNESCIVDNIKEIILNKINTSSWDAGNGRSIVTSCGHLIVLTNNETHELIREFLKELLAGKVKLLDN